MNWKNLVIATFTVGTVIACNNVNQPKDAHNHEHTGHEHAESVEVSFTDEKAGSVYQHYLHLKDALIEHDNEGAQKRAEGLANALAAAEQSSIAEQAVKIKEAAGLEEKRALLDKLSGQLTEYFKANKPSSGTIYVQHCPMANNDNGGSWLASEKQIRNPYYGDKMMACGTVEEEIY
ncbi:DUF3347 domain-containing protein [Pseudoxanthomonas sp. SGD-10]|nr:DUF3347 domain-containing protein [Pseudoxanthomonas sp. SGD-10]